MDSHRFRHPLARLPSVKSRANWSLMRIAVLAMAVLPERLRRLPGESADPLKACGGIQKWRACARRACGKATRAMLQSAAPGLSETRPGCLGNETNLINRLLTPPGVRHVKLVVQGGNGDPRADMAACLPCVLSPYQVPTPFTPQPEEGAHATERMTANGRDTPISGLIERPAGTGSPRKK